MLSMRRATAAALRWQPAVGAATPLRFASNVQLQTDFGRSTPAGRPKNYVGLYVTEPVSKPGSFNRYLAVARSQAGLIVGSIACVAVYSAATLAIPAGFGELIDHASRGEMPWNTSWRLLTWFSIAGVGNFGRLAFIGYAGERVITRLRARLFRAMAVQPASFFDSPQNRTGALVTRLVMDTNVVGSSLTEALSQGAKNVLQCFGALGVMVYFSPQLTALIACILPPVAIFAGIYGRYVRRLQQQQQDAIANMATVAEERLAHIRTVKAFAREEQEQRFFAGKAQRVLNIARSMVLINATYVALLHVSGYMTLYCILWAGSMLVATNDLSAGTLFSFMLYTIYCGIGITGVTNLVSELNKGYGASIRMFDVIDAAERQEEEQKAQRKTKLQLPRGEFAFEKVGFAYSTRPEATIFKDFTLKLVPGRCTVIVGSSGSGKSTMALLLLKLYEATNGKVSLDGHDVATLDTAWLRSIIGYVPQDPVLFGGTIAQNILYGVPGREWDTPVDPWMLEAAQQAAAKANAHDFITALPDQYNTFVGEAGRSLSGGQKQRIAIARALVKHPQLLMLDEATSALDSESEVVVQEAIERIVQDARGGGGGGGGDGRDSRRSVLMFAHRLSMIRQADTVALLRDGRIVDQGTFDEMVRNPYFRQLVGVDEDGSVASGNEGKEGSSSK